MKAYREAVGGGALPIALELLPPLVTALTDRALRKSKGQLKLLGNLGISNVRGPTNPMYMAGGKVKQWISVGQVTSGIGLNITAWSYVDKFTICLMSDRKVVKDGHEFMGYIRNAFNEYLELYNQGNSQQESVNS